MKNDNLKINTDLIKIFLVEFIRKEINRAGFKKGIIGLSGGVDSALVTFLVTEALGKDNVLAVMMPYKTSNPDSLTDAKSIVSLLGIRSETVDISPMVDEYVNRNQLISKVRKGNIMARQRMIVLYDISAREHALVIGTSNKTEILLGYGTLFGDTACAINPIGDLYKTQVWQLAETIGIPQKIREKKPTADLWQGQTDEDELGFSYKQVDRLLYCMFDNGCNNDDLLIHGFEQPFIDKVKRLVQQNKFKCLPPIIATLPH